MNQFINIINEHPVITIAIVLMFAFLCILAGNMHHPSSTAEDYNNEIELPSTMVGTLDMEALAYINTHAGVLGTCIIEYVYRPAIATMDPQPFIYAELVLITLKLTRGEVKSNNILPQLTARQLDLLRLEVYDILYDRELSLN